MRARWWLLWPVVSVFTLSCEAGRIRVDGDTPGGGGGLPSAPSCAGSLTVGEVDADACGLAGFEITASQASPAAVDGSLVAGEASCFLALTVDDLCGPGPLYVGGGLSGSVSGCGGADAPLDSGRFDVSSWEVEPLSGGASVAVTVTGRMEGIAGGLPVTLDLELVTFADPATAPADVTACSNVPRVDTLTTSGSVPLDVLFVVDNSGSMAEEQSALVASFPEIFDAITAFTDDYHVGVITTDTDAPTAGNLQAVNGQRYIDPTTRNPEDVFAVMSRPGTGGSPDERGRRAVRLALTPPLIDGINAGFYRQDAALAIIVLSDEDDDSRNAPSRADFITFLDELKGDPALTSFSSIVGPVGGCPTAFAGDEYLAVTAAVGGVVVDICDGDYASAFPEIGEGTAAYGVVELAAPAVPASVSVARVKPNGATVALTPGTDWELLGPTTLRFLGGSVPPESEVIVTWTPAR